MRDEAYWNWMKYKASTGDTAELAFTVRGRGARWMIALNGSAEWFGKFKTKFDALLFAAHEIGLSGVKANWSPQ